MKRDCTETVAAYFDERADGWLVMEANTSSAVQPAVARMAGVREGARVLDIGCGLGVMARPLLEAGASFVLGVDVSPRMIARAQARWAGEARLAFMAANAATLAIPAEERFDAVVIYNAYPHFMDKPALVQACHRALVPGGRFVVAHSTGRAGINAHHDAVASGVSVGLQAAAAEAATWEAQFAIDGVVDTPAFFAFCGYAV